MQRKTFLRSTLAAALLALGAGAWAQAYPSSRSR